jgi:tetratricopeptide (TPR) repeat protein
MALENYNVEQVLSAATNCGKLELALKILEKNEQWNYAFKVSLYGLQKIETAQIFADRSGHPEAWHALAEFNLLSGDAIAAVKFAMKSGNFRRQKELVIMLRLNEHYNELLDFLMFLKSSPSYEPVYEREVFLCLIKLGKVEELNKFIESAAPSLANEFGKVLYREGSIDLAAKCFKQAGNFEKASSCLLNLGNIDAAAELAMKTTGFE